ncbi:MAG TPA: hypothetical protein VM286_00735 [Candidatus Thermoplasmatota archaeon]|nr:hypothetical protein [Candidatus Thermoplasmatota archaeon]
MARDANINKRDALVIPGGLLGFYGGVGLVLMVLRGSTGACGDGMRILYHGACYSLLWPCVLAVVLGAILVGLGVFLFSGEPEGLAGRLHPGSPTHFAVALLISLVAVPFLAAGVAAIGQGRLGTTFTVGSGDIQVKTTFLLELVGLIGLLMLAPFLILLLRDGARRRAVLREAEEMADEPSFPGEPSEVAPEAPPEEFVDESAWPEGRQEDQKPVA